jgi:hypothetical protein
LTVSEGQDRVYERELEQQIHVEVQQGSSRTIESEPKTRALRTCSLCGSLTYNARTCSRR